MHSLYSEQRTWLHRCSAGLKLSVLAVCGTLQFFTESLTLLGFLALVSLLLWISLGRAGWAARRLLTSLLLACLLIVGFHSWAGQPLVGVMSILRLITASLLGIALTITTPSGALLSVLEAILSPLKRVGIRTDRLALQLGLMLRFTEHFFVLWRRLDDAHRVRTGRSGGLRLLAPLTIQMLLAARRVADTLQLRLGDQPP